MDKFGFYRGKKDYGDEWIFGQLINVENDSDHTIIATSFKRGGLDDIVPDFYFVDPDTLSKFTTLYDKDNNPIYEGDIVECNFCNKYVRDSSCDALRHFIVVWRCGKFELEERSEGNEMNPSYFAINNSKDLKVIGNIFDKK
jgi:uncharacterized phage protein (TIGR01671 family)